MEASNLLTPHESEVMEITKESLLSSDLLLWMKNNKNIANPNKNKQINNYKIKKKKLLDFDSHVYVNPKLSTQC